MLGRPIATALVAAALALPSACARLPGAARAEGPSAGAQGASAIRRATDAVDEARLLAATDDPSDWLSTGRTPGEQRFSPLHQIDTENVGRLGLAWSFDLGTHRGVEATPIVVDGVMYTTAPWSVVYALDARSGRELWRWDPKVPPRYAALACCDVVNRGVALYRGKVYVGTLDGRLAALDAATGKPIWIVDTVPPKSAYTITGAPRIVAGRVVIGNGGGEYGMRGYVSAYDAETGKRIWRTYTVPGDPSKPFESEAMRLAAKTWRGQWWKVGGGAPVWDSMAYDPKLGLLYVGTGNASPWEPAARGGRGDDLYAASILALRASDGKLVWYYQTTPGDAWDYDSTQHLILADLPIGGRVRHVIMQAPKNGFFYVLDRATGRLLSAKAYVPVTWAKGIDPKTGRPIEAKGIHYSRSGKTVVVKPAPYGGHNWQPMSFSPRTGLVYIPAQDVPALFRVDPAWHYRPDQWNTGTDFGVYANLPADAAAGVSGALIAWDPVHQREVWRAPYATAWNGGVLSTGGGLVFEGTADGRFVAYRADDGKKLWEHPADTGIIAAPITYQVDGVQYVTVMAGWGGAFALAAGPAAAAAGVRSVGRVLTFALDARGVLPPAPPPPTLPPAAVEVKASPAQLERGSVLYQRNCGVCHGLAGVGGGVIPDLRYSSPDVQRHFADIVIGGLQQGQGMPSFAGRLTPRDVRWIHAYVLSRAQALRQSPHPGGR